MTQEVAIYCPDCRGRFLSPIDEIIEGELIECLLCAAELEVVSEDPIKIRLYQEENDFA